MHTDVSPACMSVYHVYAPLPFEARRGCLIPGTGVTDGSELPRKCWESNPGSPEEQTMFLTAMSSLQSQAIHFWHNYIS